MLTDRHREGLKKLLDFKFKRHSLYKLDSKRLMLTEGQIHERARELLG